MSTLTFKCSSLSVGHVIYSLANYSKQNTVAPTSQKKIIGPRLEHCLCMTWHMHFWFAALAESTTNH
eukprot:1366631-Amphidinium_carterae.2